MLALFQTTTYMLDNSSYLQSVALGNARGIDYLFILSNSQISTKKLGMKFEL